MLKDTALGQIRHYITIGGGYLIGAGVATQADVDTIIGGVLSVAGVLLSILDKYLAKRVKPA